MLEFIAQYWLTFLFGLISGGLVLLCKKLWNLYQNEKKRKKSVEQEALQDEITDAIDKAIEESKRGDEALQEQIDIIKNGILSIQRIHFKNRCKEFLKEDHKVTMEEFESITEDHVTYNSLGGNHDGDALYDMVKKKAGKKLTD